METISCSDHHYAKNKFNELSVSSDSLWVGASLLSASAACSLQLIFKEMQFGIVPGIVDEINNADG